MLPFQSIVGLQWPIWKCARLNQETACTCRHAIKSLLWNYTVWEKTPSLREKIPFYRARDMIRQFNIHVNPSQCFNRLRNFQRRFHATAAFRLVASAFSEISPFQKVFHYTTTVAQVLQISALTTNLKLWHASRHVQLSKFPNIEK